MNNNAENPKKSSQEDNQSLPEGRDFPNNNQLFEKLLEEQLDFLELLTEVMDQPLSKELPPDLMEKFEKLNKDINEFCKLNKELMEKFNVEFDKESPQMNLTQSQRLSLRRKEKLLQIAEEKMKNVEEQREEKGELSSESDETHKTTKNGSKQFKRFGLRNQWRHL